MDTAESSSISSSSTTAPRNVNILDLLRFRADHLYRQGDYSAALEIVLDVMGRLQIEGDQGCHRRKEWVDMAARCGLRLHRLDDALTWAQERVCYNQIEELVWYFCWQTALRHTEVAHDYNFFF